MIKITSHLGIYTLETSQELNLSLEKAWDYLSRPESISEITPKEMGFDMTSKAFEGQIITCKV